MNGAKLIIAFFGLGAVLTLSTPDVRAATYYVDYDTGSDSDPGLTQATAWKHSPGMAGASGVPASMTPQPGDIFYFKKGVTWLAAALPLRPVWSGTATQPITFAAMNGWGTGEYAIFDGGSTDTHVIDFDNYNQHHDLVFDGLWVRNSAAEVVFIRENIDLTFRNCKVSNVNALAVPIFYTQRRAHVERCVLDATNVTSGNAVLFQGSRRSDPNMAGASLRESEVITGGASSGGVRFYGAPDSIVERNYFHGATNASQYVFVWRSSDPGTVRYNIIDARGAERALTSWTGGAGASVGHKFYNNTLIGDGTNYGFVCPSEDYDGFQFRNNIFINFAVGIDSNSDATITNNVFYGTPTQWTGSGTFTTSDNITADPLLTKINSLPNGVQLQSASPAIDAGIAYDGYHNGVNTDYFGTTVPRGSAPEIGAHEYVSGAADTLPPSAPTSLSIR